MAKKMLIGFIVCMLAGCGGSQGTEDSQKINTPNISQKEQVVVYYFHGNFRCVTCKKLEQYSQDAVAQNFGSEVSSGRVVFKEVNVDEKANQHFVKKYGLYTKSLVLSLVKDGKEVKNKNLSKIWELVGNKDKYFKYVKDEIDAFVKEL
jgi:hypothetical protein